MDPSIETHPLLVVDDNEKLRTMLAEFFQDQGIEVSTACDGGEAIDQIHEHPFSVIITDLNMPEKNGLDVLRAAREYSPDTQVIIVTGFGTIEDSVEAMRLGANDFISKPLNLQEIELKVKKALEKGKQELLRTWSGSGMAHIVGGSKHTKQLLKMIRKIGPSTSSVLITGSTGTGKELVAHAVHETSPRFDKPFVTLNCAALAPGILESELFGHEKGSFTGATQKRIGRFEQAHSGTLFLDEVGEIDPSIQVKLLRVIQEGEFERVGGTDTIRVDVRIVAATNRDLREAISCGEFREDFFYRLNVFSLRVEPLCNRRDDIPALVDRFIEHFCAETGSEIDEVDDKVMQIFMDYAWPGNIRELENVMERAVVLAESKRITLDEIPIELIEASSKSEMPQSNNIETSPFIEQTDQLESELIVGALNRFKGNKTKAAEHLGLKRTTLQYKIKKYGLE